MTEPIEPLRVDLARVVWAGTALWGVALVVSLILAATDRTGWTPVWVCVAGTLLGFAGVWWAHGHDDLGRRLSR